MSGKGGPPKGEPWVWLTRDLLRSQAWRGLGINARRLVDFLLIEYMNHGGKRNGHLLAVAASSFASDATDLILFAHG